MEDEQFQKIAISLAKIEVYLKWIFNLVLFIFVINVIGPTITPTMKSLGIYNILHLPE